MQTRTLSDPAKRAERLARIHEPHVRALTDLSDEIAQEMRWWTPNFDPESGGVKAKVLLLLESPGPRVSDTGFISQDNPDQTAENMSCLLKLSGLDRSSVLLWNIVPWQMSAKGVVAPTSTQLEQAAPYTLRLLDLLPEVQAVVLIGLKAQRGWAHVLPQLTRTLPSFLCPHPSPLNFNPHPEKAARAIDVLVKARAHARDSIDLDASQQHPKSEQ